MWSYLASALYRIGDRAETLIAGQKMLELQPTSAWAHDWVAFVKLSYGDAAGALPLAEKAAALDPDYLAAHCNLARARIKLGRTKESMDALMQVFRLDPNHVWAIFCVVLQAWFGQEQDYAASCALLLDLNQNTTDPRLADRIAKLLCLRPITDKARQEAVLMLARKAVELGKGNQYLPYFRMALGMAEFRAGHFAGADAALLTAAEGGKNGEHVYDTAGLYRAMSLFRLGKQDEARRLAEEIAKMTLPMPADDANPLVGDRNVDDLIRWLAYKEAKALIGFADPPH